MRSRRTAIVAIALVVAVVAAVSVLRPWGAGDSPQGVESPDEEWLGQSKGYAGPNGEGAIEPEDYSDTGSYVGALVGSRNDGGAPHEYERAYNPDGSSYDKGVLLVFFYREYGEARAREIVAGMGGEWHDDNFAWDLPYDTAYATVYFPGDVDEEELAARLEEYPEVEKALKTYYSGGEGYVTD